MLFSTLLQFFLQTICLAPPSPHLLLEDFPLEVWGHVFSFLSQDDIIHLSHTSRGMREMVLKMHGLWSHLEVSETARRPSYGNVVRSAFQSLQAFLERAGVREFELTLSAGNELAPHINALFKHCAHRLAVLNFVISHDALVALEYYRLFIILPQLKVLSIVGDCPGYIYPKMCKIVQAGQVPVLRTLRLRGIVQWANVPKGLFPNVSDLEVHVLAMEDVGIVLLACPAVQRLNLTMRTPTLYAVSRDFLSQADVKTVADGVQSIHLVGTGFYRFGRCSHELLSLFDVGLPRRYFRVDSSDIWRGAGSLFEEFYGRGPVEHAFKGEHVFAASNARGDVRELRLGNSEPSRLWDDLFSSIELPPRYLLPVVSPTRVVTVEPDGPASASTVYCVIA